jgi:transcriptional regulator with XRE-family HTH domain
MMYANVLEYNRRITDKRKAMNLLQKIRIEHGYSIRKLAKLSGVDKVTINMIELEKARPHKLTLARLAKALELPVEDLMSLAEVATQVAEPVPVALAERVTDH